MERASALTRTLSWRACRTIEGRLLAMLEGETDLTLARLNEATQAWVELDYHRRRHSEIETSPLERALGGRSVARPSPSTDVLRRAFRKEEVRTQRRSDGTITIEGVRFEIPERYRVLLRPAVRFARWDLSSADLVDARHGTHLATLLPIDKRANSNGRRRVLTTTPHTEKEAEPSGIAPRLRQLMAEYALQGDRVPCGSPFVLVDPPPPSATARGTQGACMARVTVEDCLEHEENRFSLVLLAAHRTRQIMKGAPALVHSKNRPAVTALREIASRKVYWNRPVRDAVEEFIAERQTADEGR